jgi:hypothetical protein
MIREPIVQALLKVLALSQGFKVPQPSLFEQALMHLGDGVTHDALLEHIQFAESQGWVRHDLNVYRVPRWWITEAGQIERSRYA